MSPTGLDLLFLEVNSLGDSVEFYRDKLGFELVALAEDAEPPMATLRAGSLRVTLVEQLLTMARRGRGVHFLFGVADVDAYYERLREGRRGRAARRRGVGRAVRHGRRPGSLPPLLRRVARGGGARGRFGRFVRRVARRPERELSSGLPPSS